MGIEDFVFFWYNKLRIEFILAQDQKNICNRCESPLIEVSKVVEKIANFQSLVTTTKFQCSNKECQDEADMRLAEAVQRRQQQKDAKALRVSQKS